MKALRRSPRAEKDEASRREQIESYQPGDDAPPPLPEREEPRLQDPGLRDLSRRDYVAIVKRAVKESLADGITDLAAGLAYYSFLAIPSVLLLALGIFSLAASPNAITRLMEELGAIVPAETTELLGSSLRRLNQNESSGLAMTIVGFVLALWTTTGAMASFMRALNRAYDRKETRSFVRQRLVAVEMFVVMAVAFLLVFGLLVLGPPLSEWFGSLLNLEGVFGWIWWIAQWPILIVGLLTAFATLLYLGPNVDHPRWRFLTPGALFAVAVWLAASGLFALYTSMFGSYNKTWGTLAAVIVMLTWLWLTGLALLFGAELNAEVERSRELRAGEPAQHGIAAPPKA
jgi:membrane protein